MEAKIETFKDLMDEIAYSWCCDHKFREDSTERGTYPLNKLTITPEKVIYKTSVYDLDLKVYSKFLNFLLLLEDN